jgi:hypothetical protein
MRALFVVNGDMRRGLQPENVLCKKDGFEDGFIQQDTIPLLLIDKPEKLQRRER